MIIKKIYFYYEPKNISERLRLARIAFRKSKFKSIPMHFIDGEIYSTIATDADLKEEPKIFEKHHLVATIEGEFNQDVFGPIDLSPIQDRLKTEQVII